MSPTTACLLILFAVEPGRADGVAISENEAATRAPGKADANTVRTPPASAQPSAAPASVSAPTAAARPAARTPAEGTARIDLLHRRRDEPAALAEERKLVTDLLAQAPSDYEVLWRAARFYFWLSDDPGAPNEQRSRLGKTGWDLAERAIAAQPNQIAGYYWAAVNMGNYALGLGVMKALTMGLEDKFKNRLARAEQLGADYQFGGIQVAWGRFYEKLPWPKRDRKSAEAHLRRVPNNLRGRVYLADTLAHDDRAPEAKKLLGEVAAAPVGRYDAPEERRAKALAIGLLPDVLKEMK